MEGVGAGKALEGVLVDGAEAAVFGRMDGVAAEVGCPEEEDVEEAPAGVCKAGGAEEFGSVEKSAEEADAGEVLEGVNVAGKSRAAEGFKVVEGGLGASMGGVSVAGKAGEVEAVGKLERNVEGLTGGAGVREGEGMGGAATLVMGGAVLIVCVGPVGGGGGGGGGTVRRPAPLFEKGGTGC